MKNKFTIQQVVAAGIGTALFVVLTEVQIPAVIVPNTALQVRAGLLAFIAAVYGPVVGGIVGLLGHALGDAFFYGSIWWSWVIPDALFGVAVGFFYKEYLIRESGFAAKQIAIFNVIQIVANGIAWIACAPVLDILIYAEPANKVFIQGTIASIANIVTVAILGTLLCIMYSRLSTKSSSLKVEDDEKTDN
ncbi:MAG: ECF-type riboflavin transporter substrate-binding protein [Lachnospiraceae bacterium]|nr:ECF-type riboflavin transporter substrate-binding protein [Lachnospiraceae bacterium]